MWSEKLLQIYLHLGKAKEAQSFSASRSPKEEISKGSFLKSVTRMTLISSNRQPPNYIFPPVSHFFLPFLQSAGCAFNSKEILSSGYAFTLSI